MRIPEREMCNDLRNQRDAELLDDENVCTAMNRHLRLYVAGWMLSDGTRDGDFDGMRKALALYEGCGRDLMNKPGHLTTAAIVAEVISLMPDQPRRR